MANKLQFVRHLRNHAHSTSSRQNELVDILLPYLTVMVERREATAIFSRHQTAIITPLSKKSSLDANELKNYRPVSNLSFPSKVIERTVAEQFVAYLQVNDLLPHFHSASRRHHSTETALLQVLSDVYADNDRQDATLLGLLDLSAKFDSVDHDILVDRLRQSFGICGVALTWIQSFLHGRTQQVSYPGVLSTMIVLILGVPQGSVLGPRPSSLMLSPVLV